MAQKATSHASCSQTRLFHESMCSQSSKDMLSTQLQLSNGKGTIPAAKKQGPISMAASH